MPELHLKNTRLSVTNSPGRGAFAGLLSTRPLGLLMITVPLLLAGCAQFDLRRNIPWKEVSDKPVQSVVVFWTEALIERRSGPPYRGFGGRVYFYPADMSRPMKVRGTLVVYAFDDNLPPPENLKPVRKFVFTNEQLEKVYADSKLGPSYNILIPWDEYSPTAQRISLIARFIPENGSSVVSEQARVFLPGMNSAALTGQPQKMGTSNPSARPERTHGTGANRSVIPTSALQNTGANFGSPVTPAAGVADSSATFSTREGSNSVEDRTGGADDKAPRRRMQTMTLSLSSRGRMVSGSEVSQQSSPSADPPAGKDLGVDTTKANSDESSGKAFLHEVEATRPSNLRSSQHNGPSDRWYPQWNPPGSPLEYEPPQPPARPGTLIGQLSQQPPIHSGPYRSPVPRGEGVPAPVDHSLKPQSP